MLLYVSVLQSCVPRYGLAKVKLRMQAGGASANSVSGVFTRAARCSPTTHFTQSSLDRAVSDDLALDDSKRRLCPDPLCPPTTHNALCRPVCSPTRCCTTCRISLFAPSALVWTAPQQLTSANKAL